MDKRIIDKVIPDFAKNINKNPTRDWVMDVQKLYQNLRHFDDVHRATMLEAVIMPAANPRLCVEIAKAYKQNGMTMGPGEMQSMFNKLADSKNLDSVAEFMIATEPLKPQTSRLSPDEMKAVNEKINKLKGKEEVKEAKPVAKKEENKDQQSEITPESKNDTKKGISDLLSGISFASRSFGTEQYDGILSAIQGNHFSEAELMKLAGMVDQTKDSMESAMGNLDQIQAAIDKQIEVVKEDEKEKQVEKPQSSHHEYHKLLKNPEKLQARIAELEQRKTDDPKFANEYEEHIQSLKRDSKTSLAELEARASEFDKRKAQEHIEISRG